MEVNRVVHHLTSLTNTADVACEIERNQLPITPLQGFL